MHDLDLSGQIYIYVPDLYDLYDVYYLYKLMLPGGSHKICMIYTAHVFLGWICTAQILHNIS